MCISYQRYWMILTESHTFFSESRLRSSRCMCECISVLSVTNYLVQIWCNDVQYGAVHLPPESARGHKLADESIDSTLCICFENGWIQECWRRLFWVIVAPLDDMGPWPGQQLHPVKNRLMHGWQIRCSTIANSLFGGTVEAQDCRKCKKTCEANVFNTLSKRNSRSGGIRLPHKNGSIRLPFWQSYEYSYTFL